MGYHIVIIVPCVLGALRSKALDKYIISSQLSYTLLVVISPVLILPFWNFLGEFEQGEF